MVEYKCSDCGTKIKKSQKKCNNCWEELVWNKKNKKSFWSRVLALNLVIIFVIWFIVSIVFRFLWPIKSETLIVVRGFINWFLGLLTLVWMPATIAGVVLLIKRKKK